MLLISGSGKPGNSDLPKARFLRKIAISNWFSNAGFTTVAPDLTILKSRLYKSTSIADSPG